MTPATFPDFVPSCTIFSSNAASCCGPLGNVVYVLPPYIISPDQLHRVYDVITEPSKPFSDLRRASVKLISLSEDFLPFQLNTWKQKIVGFAELSVRRLFSFISRFSF